MGLMLVAVLNTTPMVSFLSFNGVNEPFCAGGVSNVPMSLLFAQPIVGLSKNKPK